MGNSSSQPIPQDLTQPDRLWVEAEPDSTRRQKMNPSPQAINAHSSDGMDYPRDPYESLDDLLSADEAAEKAEKKASRARRKARKQARRDERMKRRSNAASEMPTSAADTPYAQQGSSMRPPSESSPRAARKQHMQGAAPSNAHSEGTFGIDPALEHLRHEETASAERSTANMVAPVANMGGMSIEGQENGASPAKKKRGRKSNKERLEAQQAATNAMALSNEADPNDLGPRLLTELAAAAVADEEQQQLAQLRASLTGEMAAPEATEEAPSRKRKRQGAAQEGEEAADDGAGKKRKKKTQYAKRTDGAASRSPSVEADSTHAFPESGTFTKAELKALDQFMEQWKEDHDMSHGSLADMIQSKHRGMDESEGGFWAQVFDVLPRRKDRRSVRLTCRRRYHNFERRGKWEAEDDEMLKQAWAKTPNKWTTIGEAIHRMPEDCKDRYQNYLACGDNRRVGDWTEKEEMSLALAVEECKQAARREAKDHAERLGQTFRDDKDWMSLISFKTVSQKMGLSRSGLQCRQHWKRMQTKEDRRAKAATEKKKKTWRDAQAADNYKRMLPGDKYEILHMILRTETSTEENIPWKLMTRENVESKWTTKDRKVAFEHMKKLVPGQPTLPDELNALIDYFQTHHADELAHYYSGPVRSQDAPRKAYTKPLDADQTPAARIRKGLKSKGTHKSAQNVTASDDDGDEAADDSTAIDPALENANVQDAVTSSQDRRNGTARTRKAKTATDVLQSAKGSQRKGKRAAPQAESASWFALPGDNGDEL